MMYLKIIRFTYAIFIIFYLFKPALYAQEKAVIFGKVTNENRRGIEFVNISISGSKDGISTDSKGKYFINVPADKDITLIFSNVAYNPDQISLKLKSGQKYELNRTLTSKITDLKEVEVEDKESRLTELTRIDPKTATIIPSVSGGIEALLKTLPGVASRNELSSQYSVRGGNYDENLVYVNDVEIYRPFLVRTGQQEGLSFINTDLVSSVLFSAGGFDAKYGDKMSSVLDIQYKTPKTFGGSATMSLLGGAAHVEGALDSNKLSYILGVRYKSNQYILKAMETKGEYKPSFTDIQTYINYAVNKKFDIGLLGNYSRNHYLVVPQTRETRFGTVQDALKLMIYFDGQEVDNFETITEALTATFKPVENLKLKFIASAFKTQESETYDIQGEYWLDQLEADFGKQSFGQVAFNKGVGGFLNHARNYLDAYVMSLEHKAMCILNEKNTLQWGVKYNREIIRDKLTEWNMIDSAGFSIPKAPDFVGQTMQADANILKMQNLVDTNLNISSNRITAFLMDNWKFKLDSTEMTITAGVRGQYWDLNKQFVMSPRITLSVKPNWKKDVLFRYSMGYYNQPPFYREMRDNEGKLHTNIKSQTSIHFVGAMDWNFKAWYRAFKFVSEIYYKYLYNLIPYEFDNVRIRYYPDLTSKGYATGIDLKVNGEFVKGIDSWASLSFMKTMEDVNNDGHVSVPRPTDQRVNASLFFQDYLPMNPTYKMHLNFLYGTGIPFGAPRTDIYKHTLRMPRYFRVDIGFSKQIKSDANKLSNNNPFRFFKNIWLSLEVFNLLQSNNIVSYVWITDVTGQQYAVPNYLTPRQLNLKLFADF